MRLVFSELEAREVFAAEGRHIKSCPNKVKFSLDISCHPVRKVLSAKLATFSPGKCQAHFVKHVRSRD